MGDSAERVKEKIRAFQKRYYLNIFVRGLLLTLSILCLYFLLATTVEYNLWLSPWLRLLLFVSFFIIAVFCVYKFLKEPLGWWIVKRGLNEEQSARIIGDSLPTVKDRLLNLIQLKLSQNSSALTYASIQQKSREFDPITFDSFIDLRENKRYLKYLVIPLGVILIILFINSNIITGSTDRILHFSDQYSPQAPFQFVVDQKSLLAFYNEDFTIKLKLVGDAIPDNAYLTRKPDLRLKMDRDAQGEFYYTFEKIQDGFDFQFEAAGFYSPSYPLAVERRPELMEFSIRFEYPKYLQLKPNETKNAGNIEIPEGTQVTWNIKTNNAKEARIILASDKDPYEFQIFDDQSFRYSKRFLNPDQYEIVLGNGNSQNKDKIAYSIDVVKDEFPKISVGNLKDSILYKRIMLGGNISDDYGISALALHFKVSNESQQ